MVPTLRARPAPGGDRGRGAALRHSHTAGAPSATSAPLNRAWIVHLFPCIIPLSTLYCAYYLLLASLYKCALLHSIWILGPFAHMTFSLERVTLCLWFLVLAPRYKCAVKQSMDSALLPSPFPLSALCRASLAGPGPRGRPCGTPILLSRPPLQPTGASQYKASKK